MKKNTSFWTDMMAGTHGGVSAKRVIGCFILLVLLVVIVVCTFTGSQQTWLGEAFITMLIGAFSLLGIGLFEKPGSIPKKEEKIEESDETNLECEE